jgi:hypothetical protein
MRTSFFEKSSATTQPNLRLLTSARADDPGESLNFGRQLLFGEDNHDLLCIHVPTEDGLPR